MGDKNTSTIEVEKKSSIRNKDVITSLRPRSQSLGTGESATPAKSTKTILGKCPCQKSNESAWKMKCTGCKQVWHTSCANLKTQKVIPESVILGLEKSWTCPWCFRSPYLRPPGHPSCTNETQLFGTALADAVCEKISQEISNEIIPEFELSVDNLVTTRLKQTSEKLEAQVKSIKDNIKELTELKFKLLATDETENQHNADLRSTLPTEPITPLASNPTNYIEDYDEKFLSDEEITDLNLALGSMSFTQVNGRGIASFGQDYQYRGAPKTNSKDIPEPLKNVINKIHNNPTYKDEKLNQVVVNKYSGTTHLPEHADDEATIRPSSRIVTVTLGQAMPIKFRDKVTQEDVTLEPVGGSLYAMSMESQYHWTHRIEETTLSNTTRYSLTFRSVGKQYKNSTIILGDSNTKHLKFSSGQQREKGTFGFNMPGQRVETFHINHIDEQKCLGYRNVIIHCGINDIRDSSPGRQPSDPEPTDIEGHINNLINKIVRIKNMCPQSSVVVNPLLPTKNQRLNERVLKFNSLLFQFLGTDKRGEGVRSSNFMEFVDGRGVLKEEYGVWDRNTNDFSKRDILHVGKSGIRLLAKIIRDSVYTKLITSQNYSSVLLSHSRAQQDWSLR